MSADIKSFTTSTPMRVGVLGFGGLGQAAAKLIAPKKEILLVAVADLKGYAYAAQGLDVDKCVNAYATKGSVGYLEAGGTLSNQSIRELIENSQVDGYFLALPNLPNTFIASVAQMFMRSHWQGVLVDAIKRTYLHLTLEQHKHSL